MDDCPECGKPKDEKYKVCAACNQKNPTVKQLEKNNNNLYKLTKQLDVILREKYGLKIVWREKTQELKGDFIEEKSKTKPA